MATSSANVAAAIPTPTPKPPSSSSSSSTTLRHPPYTYLHLAFTSATSAPSTSTSTSTSTSAPPPSSSSAPPIDAITARATLHRALSAALGLHGAAIPLDVLHVKGRECWVRVPRGDGRAVSAALAVGPGTNGGGKEVGVWVKGSAVRLGGMLAGEAGVEGR